MTAQTPALFRLVRGFGSIMKPLQRRQAHAQLRQLDDHLLKDIGLTRIDVDAMRRMW